MRCEGCGETGHDDNMVTLEGGCHAHDYCVGYFYPELLEMYKDQQATIDELRTALGQLLERVNTDSHRKRWPVAVHVAKVALAKSAPLDGLASAIDEVGP